MPVRLWGALVFGAVALLSSPGRAERLGYFFNGSGYGYTPFTGLVYGQISGSGYVNANLVAGADYLAVYGGDGTITEDITSDPNILPSLTTNTYSVNSSSGNYYYRGDSPVAAYQLTPTPTYFDFFGISIGDIRIVESPVTGGSYYLPEIISGSIDYRNAPVFFYPESDPAPAPLAGAGLLSFASVGGLSLRKRMSQLVRMLANKYS